MRASAEVAASAVGACLVAVATMSLQVYIPATRGYFNLGETMVYAVALLLGPRVGFVAGALGSSMADLLTGYAHYAPATFVIKGVEGFIVGYLSRRLASSRLSRGLAAAVGLALSALLLLVGVAFYSGAGELTLGLPPLQTITLGVMLSPWLWVAASAALAAVVGLGLRADPAVVAAALAAAAGGAEMVLGYFLYEQFVLGFAAIAEVPFNVGQVLVGVLVAVPLYKSLRPRLEGVLSR
ncbi:MAG: hypothetical protein DRJ56_06795 [Thermoprotei archaeon]|nr:MAG: hypothetical protein DRJ56_06795 [Thermoprotei archaeon]